jgi:hypothetical protein
MCSVDWGTKSPLPPYCTNSWLFTHTINVFQAPAHGHLYTRIHIQHICRPIHMLQYLYCCSWCLPIPGWGLPRVHPLLPAEYHTCCQWVEVIHYYICKSDPLISSLKCVTDFKRSLSIGSPLNHYTYCNTGASLPLSTH